MTKPNIVVFITDDQRFDTIAALGNKHIKTPNIDELVRNGVAFGNAHIPGGTVGAICMPSRAMLNTGRGLFHLEKDGSRIPQDHALMGETFRRAGYHTMGIGKWHNGVEAYHRSFCDGGEIFFGGMWDHWNVPANHFDPTGKYDNINNFIIDPFKYKEARKIRYDHIQPGKHSTELFCEKASELIDGYDKTDPMFLYVSLLAPHDPRSMPEEYQNMYKPEDMELPESFTEEIPFDYDVLWVRDEKLAAYPRNPAEVKEHIADYYAMITHLDAEMGKVIESLKAKGLYENTIFTFMGDNGISLGRHGLMGKQSIYEHAVRVPLIFSGPGISEDVVNSEYVYLQDVFPTLCELTGIEVPQSVEGSSFRSMLVGEVQDGRDELYLAYKSTVRGIKDRKYKLIEYVFNNVRKTQLFDIEADPNELDDLAHKEGFKGVVVEMREKLKRKRNEMDDHISETGKEFWACIEF